MGQQFLARCKECNESFMVREGGGFSFLLLHCENCGDEKEILEQEVRNAIIYKQEALSFKQEVELFAGNCRKDGGKFTLKAKARCPRCRSNNYEIHSNGMVSFYD